MNSLSSTSIESRHKLECINVLLPLPLGRAYTYAIPDNLLAEIPLEYGDFVSVPLGSRELYGVVWEGKVGDISPEKIKYIISRINIPPMPKSTRRFVEWVSKYNMASIGLVLKMLMSVPDVLNPPKQVIAYSLCTKIPKIKMTPARHKIVEVLKGVDHLSSQDIVKLSGVSQNVVKGFFKVGALKRVNLIPKSVFETPNWETPGPILNDMQTLAAKEIRTDVKRGKFAVTLLEGVPGSGKTEVYLEAICEALSKGKQALVLLPEIALGAQWFERFKERFGCGPAEWHSDLTQANRRKTWRAVATGEAKVVVGARSALFLPYRNLGVIIIDEEHDQSFKQEDGVIYNARDMAVVLANLTKIPIILVSATPSLESLQNVVQGRYGHFNLPDRYGGAQLPDITIIDMRESKPDIGKYLSPELIKALRVTFDAKEQALLFLNRRGYAPLTLCKSCGYRFQCSHCTAWLVEHRFIGHLLCHHCGYQITKPEKCPSCDKEDELFACGPGVERIAEEFNELFPEIRAEIAVSDNLQTPGQAQNLVSLIENRDIDLIIGTQIVAKGYHFPYLTLVGVIDADVGLTGGDIRALERTYQLLYQVSGRAGRGERQGRVLVQTYDPENAVMLALKDADHRNFINTLTLDRERHHMPPFGRLAGVIISGKDEQSVDQGALNLARTAPQDQGVTTLGPAPAPLAVLRGRHRRRFLVKADKEVNIQARIHSWLKASVLPRKVRVQLDIDPYSFF
ncbi:MAG: primosomal protein N' [Pseudomonadota bacterium]|nr:primosomal protein N' [Pseudomonadota bacterium]